MEEIVHPFYEIFRIVFLSASATIALAFAFQNYVDRRAVRKLLFESPRSFTTYRVFRISILCGALLHMVVGIDVFGAHGIYAPYTRVTLITLATIWVAFAFPFSMVNELNIAFQLETFGARAQKFVKHVGASTVPWCMFIVVTTKFIDSRAYFIFGRVMISCSLLALWIVNAYVYFTIRRHHQRMIKMNMSFTKDFWEDVIKKWRIYLVIGTIFVVFFIVQDIIEELNPLNAAKSRDNVNFSVDYTTTPTVGQIILSVTSIFVMMLCGWRAWLGKEQRAHIAEALSNERSDLNTSPLSANVAVADIKSVVDVETHAHIDGNSDAAVDTGTLDF